VLGYGYEAPAVSPYLDDAFQLPPEGALKPDAPVVPPWHSVVG